ncbi:MAG TPA: tetratricopeptide repeat protein [Bryobacteraceae bacterium]|nr:tetratricopeptide repeat protein [Bryobacteraceae bacterium]
MKKAAFASQRSVRRGKTDTSPPAEAAAPVAAAVGPQEQYELFDRAIALFRAGRLAEAKRLFERAVSGPAREVAHAARMHAQVCDRRLSRTAPAPSSAEDHYNLAVALINRRELEAAEGHLQEAVKLAPNADHIHYALALARGLQGHVQLACDSLRRAIDIEPRNRAHARSDPDFAGLSRQQPLAALLFPDREHRV